MIKGLKFLNKARTFTVPESIGLAEEEQARIVQSSNFEDFVVNIESLNFIFLRDERVVQFNVYIQTEKETLYGQTLKFPYPKSTNFYELLEKFNTKKRRAIDVEELEQKEDMLVLETDSELKQDTFVHSSVVEHMDENVEDDVNKEVDLLGEVKVSQAELNDVFGEAEELQADVIVEEEEQGERKECLNCGYENAIDAKFCSECGTAFDSKKDSVLLSNDNDIEKDMHADNKDSLLQAKKEDDIQKSLIVDPQAEYSPSTEDMQQLLKVKEGLKNRAQIEKDVALEFESKKAEAIKLADEKVMKEKQEQLEALNRTFSEKQEQARQTALEALSLEEAKEVNNRVAAMKSYLKKVYEAGLRSIEEGFEPKHVNE
ncbi:zinc ribbon domain-containing protein [Lactococcus muris]|uniref:Zinc ribbon domain-containing protein n=1 Tax=Lactococcus muris TaxID=2941330 RepID=A0ABV4DB39_9LACT